MLVGVGTMLAGRYRLEQLIASGGMGEVWRAFDAVLGRMVAVKRLLAALPDEPSFVDRFRAEARTMATISHPGVVEVYDFGDDPAAGVYLVMKYIEGESLAHALERAGRLSAETTMRLVAQAAEALHAAHERGVTHRDVKPGNLLLRPDGSALLTDFGIARETGPTGHAVTGSLMGTTGYMAPERVIGRPATARSDIYSLGVVAYRCLAGRLPFDGENPLEVALRHVDAELPPLPADVPPGVSAIVERAMAKDPAARWPSGAALAVEARRALEPVRTRSQTTATVPIGEPPVSGRRGARRLLVVAALLVAITTLSVILSRGGAPQPQSLAESQPAATPVGNVAATGSPAAATSTPGPTATRSKPVAGTALPAAPKNLTATPIGAHTIRLQWSDASADEEGFTVINGITSADVGANTTTYDWNGITPDTRTCFKVRAFNAAGVSAYHPAAEGEWVCTNSLPGVGPAAPTNLTATTPNPSTIRLQWTDNSSDEEGFTITNAVTSRDVGPNTTTYEWTGLAPATYMCFKVRSYKSSGVSAYYPAASPDWICITTPTS
jgi:serine/threonine-protein kinase